MEPKSHVRFVGFSRFFLDSQVWKVWIAIPRRPLVMSHCHQSRSISPRMTYQYDGLCTQHVQIKFISK